MLQFIYNTSFLAITLGWLFCAVHAAKLKHWKKLFLVCFLPFYVVRYLLQQSPTTEIKIYTILMLGGTVIAVVSGILITIYTVPI